jgi:hypothetical protein
MQVIHNRNITVFDMWRRVVWWVYTNVSEEHSAFVLTITISYEPF